MGKDKVIKKHFKNKKGKKDKEALDPLPLPCVSDKDLKAAKTILDDEAQRKRILSQMRHFLTSEDLYERYQDMPMPERKKYLRYWTGKQIETNNKSTGNCQCIEKL